MAGGLSGYLMTAGSSGERKRKGETPMGGFGIVSTVSRPSVRRVRKLVKRCCRFTRHSTCSTTGPSARLCKFRNSGRQCTRCYCWESCKNKGRLMPSLTMVRGPARTLPALHRPTYSRPVCLTPACPVTKIFVPTGDIDGRGQGRRLAGRRGRMQETEGRRRGGGGEGGGAVVITRDGGAAKRGKAVAASGATGTTGMIETAAETASRR